MRGTIPIMALLEEIQGKGLIPSYSMTMVKYKAFTDNYLGTIKLACLPKMRGRTKHINVSYCHFLIFLMNGGTAVLPILTHEQVADLLIKPLPQN